MTTKTDSFPTVQNPLSGHWATTYGGLRCTAAGVVKGTGVSPQDNISSWSTSDYTFQNDQTSAVAFSNITSFDWPGSTVRISGTTTTATGYVAYATQETTAVRLFKIVAGSIGAGSANLLANYTGLTLTGSHVLELDIAGTLLTVKLDGTILGTFTDSSYASGQPGMAYEFGGSNASQINSYTATDAGGAPTAYAEFSPWGPGITPFTQTMFTPRPVSNFIVQGTSKGIASGQGFAVGLLTGAIIVPVIGYVRTSGPGISPDYKRTFDQIPRSTTLPNFAQLTGRALGSGYALASLTGVAAIQGLSLGQGSGVAGPLTGAGALTGLASGEGAALGLLSSGAVSSITGVALGSGYALGAVTGAGVLRGIASAEGTARATLSGAGVLTGQAVGQGFGRGTLLGSASLSGVGVGSGYALGLVGAGGNLTGFAFGSGYALASLTGGLALSGRVSGEGTARAPLVGAGALSGTAHGQGSATGLMAGVAQIQGVSLGQSHALGLLLPAGSGQLHGVAAGFSFAFGLLSGNGHTFGHCTVDALSQNGLPVARPCYIEESACFVVASYFDNTSTAFVPNAVQYRIDDVVSGANILEWTSIVPGITNEVVVTSAQNAMINNSRSSESHQVLFQVTDGFGNVTYADVSFDVIRVAGLG